MMSMETSKRHGGEEEEECERMIKKLEEVEDYCQRMIKKLNGKAADDDNNGGGNGNGIVVSSSEKLMEEILLWLPPASVARFKSVSSNWMQRLSKPSFAEQHEVRNLSLLGFYYNKSYAHVQFAHVGNSFSPLTSTTTGYIEPNEFYSAHLMVYSSCIAQVLASKTLIFLSKILLHARNFMFWDPCRTWLCTFVGSEESTRDFLYTVSPLNRTPPYPISLLLSSPMRSSQRLWIAF
uniref:F-box domain-containing protein n=1 Tax=Davidia involucrata TaxID=16924 RepID=A0A5B7B534_DAVIN